MLDPYRMVIINIAASLLILTATLFYRFVYPKRKINMLALLLIVSLLPCLSLLRAGDYESGDFNIHIYRIISFYDSLKEGIIMPSWAAELNSSYGNPLFIFNYSLPYYVISFFHFVGLSFIESMKVYFGLSLYLSGVFMYLWIKELSNNKLAAFVAAIFYLFNPYHLIDVHFRATLGESTIFIIIPLLFLFITKYFKENKFIFLVLISLSIDLLFLAHPLLGGFFVAISTLYILYTSSYKNKKPLLLSLIALFTGAMSSIYAWISYALYSPFIFKMTPIPGQELWFYPIKNLLFSSYRFGLLFQGPKGELSLVIGYIQIFIVIISIILIFLNKVSKNIRKEYIFWVVIFFITLFLMSPISRFLWNYTQNIGGIIIPFGRLSLILSLCTSVIAGYFVLSFSKTKIQKVFMYILAILAIATTILNWGQRRVIPEITDDVLIKNVGISTLTEGTTAYFLNNKWADINNFWFSKPPKKHLQILKGEGSVKQLSRSPTKHVYSVNALSTITIQENTLLYPGWSLKSNNKLVQIFPGKRGIINAVLPKGLQTIELYYDDIFLYKVAKIISFISFLCMILIVLIYYFAFLPYHNISPGRRKVQLGLRIKKGLRSFIR